MTTSKFELIKQHIDSFPVLPVTVTRLMRVTNDPECSVQDVVETIHTDQSLCLTVLKIANSVLFGRPQKVDSIKMAVVILGFNEVQRIALTKAFINSFGKMAKRHKSFVDKFWQHSFVCGMAARHIGQETGISPDIAFMGGLIHDIGKLIMLETFADDYAPERWLTVLSNEERLHQELQLFSFTHDMLGGQLLKKWFFPETLITAVAYHHRPGEAKQEALASLIQLADLLSFYSCNQHLLEEDDILPAIHTALPDMQYHWERCGIIVEDDDMAEWYKWLVENHEHGSNLKEAFSA